MRRLALPLFLLCSSAALAGSSPAIHGRYLESRTADVYTGPCFANAEMGLTGKEALLAWHVHDGAWNGVALDGLAVVAVVKASATLGDPHASPLPARSVLLVDERASLAQRHALVAFATEMGGELLGDTVAIESVPIAADFDSRPGFASVVAGNRVELRTRALAVGDHHCGNEEVFYPPLTATVGAVPAVALVQAYRGPGLGGTWSSSGKRSAFVASFTR